MKLHELITFSRRWAILGMIGFSLVWINFTVYHLNKLIEADGDVRKLYFFADHIAFYTGARVTKIGPEHQLYNHSYTEPYQRWLFYIHPTDKLKDSWHWLEAFRNPPFYAMLYWPTCEWTYIYSATFWMLVSFGCYAAGTRWLVGKDRYGRSLLWVLCFYPTVAAIDYGQNPPLSFAIFAATFALLKKERPFAAGLVAGLLLYKPNLLLGLGIWAILDYKKKWPCALGVITTGMILATISWMVLPEASKRFVASLESNREFDSFEQYKMHNPLAMARLLLPPHTLAGWIHGDTHLSEKEAPDEPYWRAVRIIRRSHNVIAIGMGLLAVAAFIKLYRRRGDDLRVMFGGVAFLTLYANPHALIYEWMLLAITGLLWVKEWKNNPNAWFLVYLAAWTVLFFSTDLNSILLNDEPQELFGLNFGQCKIGIQWSVPVLTVVGWYALKLLTKPQTEATAA